MKCTDCRSHALWALPCLALLMGAMGCDPGGATAPSGGIVPPKGPANMSLIDSLEDGDGWIDEVSGRAGPWYTYNDGTQGGAQYPRGGDPYAADFASDTHKTDYGTSVGFARTTGSGFADWGAGFGFDLAHPDTAGKAAYGASAYTGLKLWIRAHVNDPAYISLMTIKLLDADNVPPSEGGVCIEDPAARCQDVFSYNVQLQAAGATPVTADFSIWQPITIKFSDFKQAGWGKVAANGPDLGALLAIHFQFDSPGGKQFDVSVDDIAFTTD